LTGHGGFLQVFTNGLTGLRWRAERVRLDPMLPPQLRGGVTLKGLHWQGRTFDITIGPHSTTVAQQTGSPLPVESPQGTQLVSAGHPLSLKTRRPDLTPTANLARCKPAQPSSEEAGLLAEAAVDGSMATIWAPAPTKTRASLRVDLGQPSKVARITPHWTVPPSTHQIVTSTDATTWTPAPPAKPDGTLAHPVNARYIRVDLTRPRGGQRIGIRELEVIRR
ncbi:MAG: discoidin domain-containing protein, partial [Frankiaceae bacterium]